MADSSSVLTEWFKAVAESSELECELVVEDPVNFTAPVTLTMTSPYVPDVELIPFECAVVDRAVAP